MFTKSRIPLFALAPVSLAVCSSLAFAADNKATAEENPMEVMLVTADFRGLSVEKIPSSVTVIDAQKIEDEGARHFEDILGSVANFNWSGGTSRPRYFQIRGVGEQEDYKGAPNSSVGYLIDDIDLSGLGMVSSMYDLQQVEVLRGPQGTRYGANALAGLIYLKSNDPTEQFEHGARLSLGNDNLKTFAGFSSGPMMESGELLYRVAIEQHRQDGFRDNLYLDRSDTNKRDELSFRTKVRWYANDHTQVDFTLMHADFDNGYDAWTLDNNGFDTLTDMPGTDAQRTTGVGLKLLYDGFDKAELTSLTSFAGTDHHHGYDGDWANPEYWAARQCTDDYDVNGNGDYADLLPCEYDYTWDKRGDRSTVSQEFRLASNEAGKIWGGSTAWLVGLYGMQLKEDNDLASFYNGWPDETLRSSYEATNLAIFGQLDSDLGQEINLSVGLRLERRDADYSDDAGDAFDPSETMWGGHIAIGKQLNEQHNLYGRIARGYKAGGFNMSLPAEFADKKEFDTEVLYNYEIGLKSSFLEGNFDTNLALFFMDRQDQQVSASQQDPAKPQRFVLFTENAGSSTNYGAELDLNWYATDNLHFYGSLGYLKAEYGDYSYQDKYGGLVDLSGRELAHAPNWTWSLGTTWRADSGFFVNLNANGKSKFYYSDSNDSVSKDYGVLNARAGFEGDIWSVYVWGRNLLDEEYGVRGFYFGNEPDNGWADKQYIRFGDPRAFGLTLDVRFL
ncbi:TonB-dependent receptor [Shewanella amazonensis]|uniref:TonB-dependent receptor n=1 Tax=Shewanella amazonensis (strain ATCC BAA-1098 / SB2B) TaxID=326297 RepID=A1S5K2_SHEAM|nr:TonB-dependent receptor [Shewanella amazonensis]ABL99658.1 TonB-dependent receptor [Shewanella amazonensis SB2B]